MHMENVYNEIKTQPKFHINIAFFLSLKTFLFPLLVICCYALTKIIFLIILKEIYSEKFTFILLKNNIKKSKIYLNIQIITLIL